MSITQAGRRCNTSLSFWCGGGGLSTRGGNGFIWMIVPKPGTSLRLRNRIFGGHSDDADAGIVLAVCRWVQKAQVAQP